MPTKYVFVTGGVVSGLGKGITAASLGRLLKARGYSVTIQKFDPYINVDPGTMSPYQHGEVFVTDDGAETDLDLVTTRDLSTKIFLSIQMLPQVRYTGQFLIRREEEIILAAQFRSFLISPTR